MSASKMSFTQKLVQAFPQHEKDEPIALAIAVSLIATSDGEIDEREQSFIGQLIQCLPEFRNMKKDEVVNLFLASREKLAPYKDKVMAVHSLKQVSEERLRKRCFLLALETAIASGHLEADEIRALEKFVVLLELDKEWVDQVTDILLLKYR